MPPCKDQDSGANTFNKFFEITTKAERGRWLSACPTPCQQKSYNVKIERYHMNSWIDPTNMLNTTIKESSVYLGLFYDSLGIIEKDETLVYDVGSFLSAAGGNLGLLLGFSCLFLIAGILKVFRKKTIQSLCNK